MARSSLKPEEGLKGLRTLDTLHDLVQRVAVRRSKSAVEDGPRLAGEILKVFGKHLLIGRFGEDEVLRGVDEATRLVRLELMHMLPDVVPPDLSSDVGLHNDVEIQTDPATLMSFVIPNDTTSNGVRQIAQINLRSKHARTMLVLGIMGFLLGAVDEADWVSMDVKELMDSVQYDARMRNVRVVAGLQAGTTTLERDTVRVFLEEEHAQEYARRLEEIGLQSYRATFMCREATVDGETFYVHTNARRKTLFAALLKALRKMEKEPEEQLRDNRGMKDLVVATRMPMGDLQAATRKDAERWEQVIRSHVFALPLVSEDPPKVIKRARHKGQLYWDRKILGRIVRSHDDYRVSGRFEWIIQPITDHLHAMVSVTDDHHDMYAMRRIWLDLLPVLFPHRVWGREGSEEYARVFARWLRIVQARLST